MQKAKLMRYMILIITISILSSPHVAFASFKINVGPDLHCSNIYGEYDKLVNIVFSNPDPVAGWNEAKRYAASLVSKWPDCRYSYIYRAQLYTSLLAGDPANIKTAIKDLNKAIDLIKTQAGLATSATFEKDGKGGTTNSFEKSTEGADVAYGTIGIAYMLKCGINETDHSVGICEMNDKTKPDIENAIEAFTESLRFDNKDLSILYGQRAEAYEILGDKEKALKDYSEYKKRLSKKHDKKIYEEVEQKLKELSSK